MIQDEAKTKTAICYDPRCQEPIADEVVWLGETYDGVEMEFPFHVKCADGPWPLYEIRREVVKS